MEGFVSTVGVRVSTPPAAQGGNTPPAGGRSPLTADLGIHAVDPVDSEAWDRLETMATNLADAVDAKGCYRPSHSHSVARLATTIGAHLGIRGPALTRVRLAGLLHDAGKLQTPDCVLLKPGQLSRTEYDVVKLHVITGHQLLLYLGLPDEARWVLHHHERADGTGYPSGLAGKGIPLGARILQVADAFDCITTDRLYSARKSREWALGELAEHIGDQFDAECVGALTEALTGPIEGMLVAFTAVSCLTAA
jgi:HD-GYP domain-containing protein (c-di-GMP phosphodiesterase class II)